MMCGKYKLVLFFFTQRVGALRFPTPSSAYSLRFADSTVYFPTPVALYLTYNHLNSKCTLMKHYALLCLSRHWFRKTSLLLFVHVLVHSFSITYINYDLCTKALFQSQLI